MHLVWPMGSEILSRNITKRVCIMRRACQAETSCVQEFGTGAAGFILDDKSKQGRSPGAVN